MVWSLLHDNVCTPYHWLCRIGPEKGVIHIATGAVANALWDLFAKSRKKPLWKLIVDMTPEELVDATTFRYITDVITRDEALAMLKAKESTKKEREENVRKLGSAPIFTSHQCTPSSIAQISGICDFCWLAWYFWL